MSNDLAISPDEFHFQGRQRLLMMITLNISTFTGPYTRNSETDLHLVNQSADHFVAFKIKTIDIKRYESDDEYMVTLK